MPLCTYIGIPIFCIYLLPIYGFLIIVFYSITYTITYKYYINTTIVDFHKKDLALDPYIVGLLIGDGSLTGNGSIELSLALNQRDALKDMRLPEGIKYTVKEDLDKHYLRVKFS